MAGFLSSAATQRPTLRHAWLCYWTFSDDGVALIKAQRPQARILVSLEEKQKRAKGDRAPDDLATARQVYWKVFVCALLVMLYSLRHFQTKLPLHGLTFAAIVYSVLGFYLVLHLIHPA
jgi:hypothetical protein